MTKSPRKLNSIWASKQDRFLTPLFSCCDAKISEEDFKSILAEITKTEGELQNLIEMIKSTFLKKEHIEILFKMFLENCKEYHTKAKKEPSVVEKLNKVLLIILHFENEVNKEKNVLVQLVMDHFESLLEVLSEEDSQTRLVGEGGHERRAFGLSRVEVLRLVHHCLMINHKSFNLMVSMSKFGETLAGLVTCFRANDRFVGGLFDVVDLVLATDHKPLIESVLGNGRVVFIVQKMLEGTTANKFMLLKLMKVIDCKFDEKCLSVLEKTAPVAKETPEIFNTDSPDSVAKTFLKDLQKGEAFAVLQIKLYPGLKEAIKIYFDLEEELKDRNNRKISGSSIFSNNLLDEVELSGELHRLPNSVDSDEKNELENMMDDDLGDNDEERLSYGGIVRRRKISEDNIKVGSGRSRGMFNSDFR